MGHQTALLLLPVLLLKLMPALFAVQSNNKRVVPHQGEAAFIISSVDPVTGEVAGGCRGSCLQLQCCLQQASRPLRLAVAPVSWPMAPAGLAHL